MSAYSGSFEFLNNGSNNPGGATFGESIGNWFTGNKDFERTLYLNQLNNAFNSAEADKNRKFQENMSNTAYQRAISDLKQAGINPALAYSNPASSPSGSSASSGGTSAFSSGKGFNALLGLVTSMIGLGVKSALQVSKQSVANKIYDTTLLRLIRK